MADLPEVYLLMEGCPEAYLPTEDRRAFHLREGFRAFHQEHRCRMIPSLSLLLFLTMQFRCYTWSHLYKEYVR